MKKNYLKPLCMTTPMRGLRIMAGSNQQLYDQQISNAGWSRETDNYDDGRAVSPRSVWDD